MIALTSVGWAQETKHLEGSAVENQEENSINRVKQKRDNAMSEVKVFPNPSGGEIFISGESGTKCTVYTSSGTYIGTWILKEGEKIMLNELGTGMYILHAEEGENKSTQRFVIL